MALHSLRGRMPLVAFLLLAVVCLALIGFACTCLGDQPMQALERVVSGLAALPALVEVWSVALAFVAVALAATHIAPALPPLALSRRLLL